MYWRIHKAIFDTRIQEAQYIIESFGDTVQIVEGNVSQIEQISHTKINEPSLAITTLQDARNLLKQDYPSSPWLFYHSSQYDVSYWSAQLPDDIPWLNRHGIFLPYQHMLSHPLVASLKGDSGKVFIRPNSGNKIFTGFDAIVDESFSEQVKNQLLFSKPDNDTLCYIAPYKNIDSIEWRFWICEHKVVAYTPYSWGEDPALFEAPQSIQEAAQKLAESTFSPDYSYVADFVLDCQQQPFLIEVNATSTCGIYSVDLNKLLTALRLTAHREYNMEIDY